MAVVGFIDTLAHPAAKPFYDWVKAEPIGDRQVLKISRTEAVDNMSLYSLAAAMQTRLPEGGASALICCHANDHSLCIPLDDGVIGGLKLDKVQAINKAMAENSESAYATAAKKLGYDVEGLKVICGFLQTIRLKRLKNIAIRACNLGQNLQLLTELVRLFGAHSLSAPMVRDAYAQAKVTLAKPEEFKKKQHDAGPRVYEYRPYYTEPRLSVHMMATGHSSFKCTIVTQSEDLLIDFLLDSFPGMSMENVQVPIIYLHGQYDNVKLVFPAQSEYNGRISRVLSTVYADGSWSVAGVRGAK